MKKYSSKETLDQLLSINPLFRKLITRPMELCFSADLTVTQLYTMTALSEADSMNMTQLASQLYISKQQLTKIVDALVEKGFVHRFGDPGNRRVVLVSLTESGQKLMRQHQELFIDSLIPAFDQLTDAQKHKLVSATEDILQILQNLEIKVAH